MLPSSSRAKVTGRDTQRRWNTSSQSIGVGRKRLGRKTTLGTLRGDIIRRERRRLSVFRCHLVRNNCNTERNTEDLNRDSICSFSALLVTWAQTASTVIKLATGQMRSRRDLADEFSGDQDCLSSQGSNAWRKRVHGNGICLRSEHRRGQSCNCPC